MKCVNVNSKVKYISDHHRNMSLLGKILVVDIDVLMKIKAIIHEAEEGGYWAEVPALPGCYTQGETIDSVIENLKEAAEGWLETEYSKQFKEQKIQQGIEVVL